MNVKEIPISKIKIVENSRIKIEKLEGLMQDIKQHGLKQAIGVAETKSGEYVLIFGNRRLAAIKKLGWIKVPANVYPDMEISELLINNMAENVHREEINPIELGRIVKKLKEMGLTISEVSSKLSLPKTRVDGAIKAYQGLPDKYRNKVAYVGGGNDRKGNIPASIAIKIMNCKREFSLSDSNFDKLLNLAKVEEYGIAELNIINILLQQEYSVSEAIQATKKYKYSRIDIVTDEEEIQKLLEKYKIDSKIQLIQSILYGELPPLKRPDFYKQKQVPVKG